jgi:multiple sugar transport system substrate-binding protein
LWGRGQKQYALPKDWDVIGIFYNRAALARAGIEPRELDAIDWNPQDGGGFGRLLARLTLDQAGENALSPRFDRTRIAQHGLLISGHPDGFGQTEWSHFAASAGFSFYDAPWARRLRYDDPVLVETFRWLRQAAQREQWIIPARHARQIRAEGHFVARRGALALGGSWMTQWYVANCKFELGIAPLPVGPKGRKTMLNSLGDSICATTRHPEEAWRWVKFLGSREGQMIVAEHGVVFPAMREAAARATAVMNARGVDVSVFLRQATAPDGTFGYPIVEHGSDLVFLSRAAMDRIFLGDGSIEVALRDFNHAANALLAEPD